MSSSFLGLQIGKSGLSAAQVALNITGQNISNADTAGYTRQTVDRSAVKAGGGDYLINQITAATNVGQGVTLTSVSQIRSEYLDEQFRDQNAAFCGSESMTQGLTYIEDLFNELDDDTSLTMSVSAFYDALSDFADDPTSEAARTTVQQTALSMTGNFNLIYNEMVDLYNDQNASVQTVAFRINKIAEQVALLNEAITEYEVSGETANDLRDQRNLLLDKLSGYTDISCSENGGMVTVRTAGETIVEGKTNYGISITTATDEINAICQRIAQLNDDILSAGPITPAQEAERDELIGALRSVSGKVFCGVDETDGTVTVTVDYVDASMTAVTDTIVTGDTFTEAADDAVIEYAGAGDAYVLKLGDTYLNPGNIQSGELFAHLSLRDGAGPSDAGIPYYISQIDGLAQSLARTFNECMNDGFTYPDEENGYVSAQNVDMFEDFGGNLDLVTAGNFSISRAVSESVWNIAASDTEIDPDAQDTQSANNVVALRLADLVGTNGCGDALDGLIANLGSAVSAGISTLDTRQSLVESIENQRKSISGVSLDEEAVNLIMFQQTYNACSRMITTVDQLLDKLINGTGKVGM